MRSRTDAGRRTRRTQHPPGWTGPSRASRVRRSWRLPAVREVTYSVIRLVSSAMYASMGSLAASSLLAGALCFAFAPILLVSFLVPAELVSCPTSSQCLFPTLATPTGWRWRQSRWAGHRARTVPPGRGAAESALFNDVVDRVTNGAQPGQRIVGHSNAVDRCISVKSGRVVPVWDEARFGLSEAWSPVRTVDTLFEVQS